MEKEKLEGLIIDYIDNRLNTADRHTVEQELAANPDARRLYEELREVIQVMERSDALEPSVKLKQGFDDMLRKEGGAGRRSNMIFFSPSFYRVAAAVALLILGAGAGFWISKYNAQQEALAQLEREMQATRKQLEDTKQLMLGMLDNELSASQRIRGVNVALEFDKADDDIVRALFNTMQNDPNTNVRLAALDALARFQGDAGVRKRLVTSLSIQKDPMVQIKLIQLLVEMKESGVVNDLKKIVDDEGTMKAVKDEAYSGILKLS
jgi:hypothetical protein